MALSYWCIIYLCKVSFYRRILLSSFWSLLNDVKRSCLLIGPQQHFHLIQLGVDLPSAMTSTFHTGFWSFEWTITLDWKCKLMALANQQFPSCYTSSGDVLSWPWNGADNFLKHRIKSQFPFVVTFVCCQVMTHCLVQWSPSFLVWL